MFGALSHDLKTLIAHLRLRTEAIENPERRAKFQRGRDDVATITRLAFLRPWGTNPSAYRWMTARWLTACVRIGATPHTM